MPTMSFDNILNQVSKRSSRSGAQSKKDDTDAVSFRFRRGSKDMFEELVEVGKSNKEVGKTNKEAAKEKTIKEAPKEKKRKTSEGGEGGKKSRTRSSGRQPLNFWSDNDV